MLELALPDLDGVQVLGELRTRTGVPVVVLSARSQRGDKVAALDAGADDYVTKPFDSEELLARIRAVLRRHQRPASPPGPHHRRGTCRSTSTAARYVTPVSSCA